MRNKTLKDKRIESFDFLKGIALMLTILFHSAIYNYANIHKIDFSNPPIVVVIMSFMALWGGIFIVLSTLVNTVSFIQNPDSTLSKYKKILLLAGMLLVFHYLLNIFLGRWNNDFVYNQPDMTVVARLLRQGHFEMPTYNKYFDGSSLSTIALNLIIAFAIFYRLFKNTNSINTTRNFALLIVLGIFIMLISFVRVDLYHLYTNALEQKNIITATFYSFTIANPYPLIPYFAYGLFGSVIGLMIINNNKNYLRKFIIPIGVLFLLYGLIGMSRFEKSISQPDYFWYFKTQFELGTFLLIVVAAYLILEPKKNLMSKLNFIKRFSRISLTVYMLETPLSEIFRLICLQINPDWNHTINGCLFFGLINVVFWVFLLKIWSKFNYKYGLEYYWVKLLNKFQLKSSKMDFLY